MKLPMPLQLCLDGTPVSDQAFRLLCRIGALILSREIADVPLVDLLRGGASPIAELRRIEGLLRELVDADLARRIGEDRVSVPLIADELLRFLKVRKGGTERKRRNRSRETCADVPRDIGARSAETQDLISREVVECPSPWGVESREVVRGGSLSPKETELPPPYSPPKPAMSRETPQREGMGLVFAVYADFSLPEPVALAGLFGGLAKKTQGDWVGLAASLRRLGGVDREALSNRSRISGWVRAGLPQPKPGQRSEELVGL